MGLVVKLYDLLEVTGGHIYPSDGAAHYEARAAARAPPPAPARRARGAAERPACERGRGAGLAARTPAPDCRLRRRRLSACWFSARSKARCWSGGSRTRTRAPPPALRAFTLWCRGSVGVCACWRAGRDGWMQHSRAPVPALREAVRLPRARRQGLQVSLGFFDDVHVAPDFLPEPSMFEPGDKGAGEWFWQYDDNRMYLERNEPVRVRVREARRSVSPFPNPLLRPLLHARVWARPRPPRSAPRGILTTATSTPAACACSMSGPDAALHTAVWPPPHTLVQVGQVRLPAAALRQGPRPRRTPVCSRGSLAFRAKRSPQRQLRALLLDNMAVGMAMRWRCRRSFRVCPGGSTSAAARFICAIP